MEGVAYTLGRRRRSKLRIDDSVPHERNIVPSVVSRRVHFDPLSLPVRVQNFTYTSPIDEENASRPLCANGRPDGNASFGAMRRSLFGSQYVHSRRTYCGSTSAVGAKAMRDGAYGSDSPLQLQPVRLGGEAFCATPSCEGDHPGARAW